MTYEWTEFRNFSVRSSGSANGDWSISGERRGKALFPSGRELLGTGFICPPAGDRGGPTEAHLSELLADLRRLPCPPVQALAFDDFDTRGGGVQGGEGAGCALAVAWKTNRK